jgi:protein-L-isoaspartate(D-aspartate) O-methyltransferase
LLEKEKEKLIEELKKMGIQDPKVLKAIRNVPRENFIPEELKSFAYENAPLAIGEEQTISQPYMVALMTEMLNPEPGKKILEIGTGSGYQAAVLAYLGMEVYSTERIYSLYQKAKDDLEKLEYSDRIHCYFMNGISGLTDEAPFDGIVLTAAAEEFPYDLEKQLNKENGILVAPVGRAWETQRLYRVVYENGERREEPGIYCRFVPIKKGLKKT